VIVRLTGVDVLALHSALTEVGGSESLLRRTSAIFLREPLEEKEFELDLSEEEIAAGVAALRAVQGRIAGVTPEEANAAVCRLEGR
jgi:hypothetical protein